MSAYRRPDSDEGTDPQRRPLSMPPDNSPTVPYSEAGQLTTAHLTRLTEVLEEVRDVALRREAREEALLTWVRARCRRALELGARAAQWTALAGLGALVCGVAGVLAMGLAWVLVPG